MMQKYFYESTRPGSVKEYIERNHSYETPCIIKLAEVEANDSCVSWIQEEAKL